MQRFVFLFLCLIVSAFARRSVPETPPRAYLPKGYPYGWGLPHPVEKKEEKEQKEVKEVKPVKRVVVKKPKDDPKAALRELRWGAVEDMLDGLE